MKPTPVGIDIAKDVFQLHYIDAETGELVNKPIKRTAFLQHFAPVPVPDRHGSVRRCPALGSCADPDGTPCQVDASGVRQGIQHPQ